MPLPSTLAHPLTRGAFGPLRSLLEVRVITTSSAAPRPTHWIAPTWLPRKTGAVMLLTVLAVLDIVAALALLATLSALTLFAVPDLANATPTQHSATTRSAPRLLLPTLRIHRHTIAATAAGRRA